MDGYLLAAWNIYRVLHPTIETSDMSVELPYNPSVFQALLPVDSAAAALDSQGGNHLVYANLMNIFKKHGVESSVGLTLLHRHYSLSDAERVVEFNDVATAWPVAGAEALDALVPRAWVLFERGIVMPYEYKYYPDTKEAQKQLNMIALFQATHSDFITEITASLSRLGLINVLGLRAYPGDNWEGRFEVNTGRVSINLLPHQAPASKSIETAWFFTEHIIKHSCKCLCGINAGRGGHTGDHSGIHLQVDR
ncbi:hypothetical protein EW146_g238 [Bondarzewia mesenterica]|uniref:Uncharacterized protein n=1 Tax=Bondarzewia mesenterica TaxID=1095465 RepID=A0A4S4MDV6_9AGAM|nr:hypothetical protein EW146_g238 [Bondarzewia mesenterica]